MAWTRGDQVNHGFQVVNKQNPVLEAVSAVSPCQCARFPLLFPLIPSNVLSPLRSIEDYMLHRF